MESNEPSRTETSVATDGDEWDRFVAARHGASVHHLWVWRDLITRDYGQRAHYLLARRAGRVAGVLPLVLVSSRIFGRSLASLPYHWLGGTLAIDAEAETALLDGARRAAETLGAESILLKDTKAHGAPFEPDTGRVRFVLPLAPNSEALFRTLRKQNRTRVRRAEREGVTVRFGHDLAGVFYDLYARTMHALGTPVNDRRVFADTLAAFGASANCAVAYDGGRPAAAKLFVDGFGTRNLIWAANDRRFLGAAANYLLMWRCLEDAIDRGLSTCDMGRSGRASPQAETKREWGCEEHPLVYDVAGSSRATGAASARSSPRLVLATRLWTRLPHGLTRVIGPRLAREIP